MKKFYFIFVFLIWFFCYYSNSCMWWTVEYTDWSNKELYFETERYLWVPDGHASPWYSWEPKREWYVFMWWSPEETNKVTKDITYVAQWKKDWWTVEYTDWSNKELYFETQRYFWVPNGHTSPWYSWEPKREWYVFMWWSPEETNKVTKDITYVAQWKKDSNGDWIPDVEWWWTVEYTDWSNKELYFETQRYLWVPDGHTTPLYSWEPKREWYVFMWWSPTVTDKVTKSVTYVAQWRLSSGDYSGDTKYSDEFNDAYKFAYTNGITTKKTIESANMDSSLTRIAMAKMLSNYAINVLGKKPSNVAVPNFPDVTPQLNADYDNWVTLAYQLWIMWIWVKNFRPYDSVTRAEFGTALSRLLFDVDDWQGAYYESHLKKLMQEKIITVDNPKIEEKRWYVMIMLMRSSD